MRTAADRMSLLQGLMGQLEETARRIAGPSVTPLHQSMPVESSRPVLRRPQGLVARVLDRGEDDPMSQRSLEQWVDQMVAEGREDEIPDLNNPRSFLE